MANTPNLDLKKMEGDPKATNFNHKEYYENNFEKVDAAIGAPPENLTTVSKTIVPAINELDDTKVDKIEGKQLSTEDYSSDEKQKLAGIEPGATADMTAEEIKVAYESNSDTNAYTNSEKAKVSNIPENTNLDLSDKAQKLKATNLVVNGDFSQGTTGWGTSGSTLSVINGKLRIDKGTRIQVKYDYPVVAGRKYYVKLNGVTTDMTDFFVYTMNFTSLHDKNYSTIHTANSNSTSFEFGRTVFINGTFAEISSVLIIDLTDTFGSGNEPTKEQMDRLLSEFPNSWFDGTQEILPLKVIPQLLEEKANKAQEAWITPTLSSGWVQGTDGSSANVGYFKDTLGFVHLQGEVKDGTANYFFRLPVGYRGAANKRIRFVVASIAQPVVVEIYNGEVWLRGTLVPSVNFNGISFRAEG